MKIEYLKSFDENIAELSKNGILPTKGCSMEEIELLEQQLNNGKPFPQVFREYLYIGGHYHSLAPQMQYRTMHKSSIALVDKLNARGANITRPIVAFDHNNEGEAYSFIYLDEGDDPQPWNGSINKAYDTDDGEFIWKSPFPSFKAMIDFLVEKKLTTRYGGW